MKYCFIIPDGMADEPIPALQDRTPLEAAATPHMDRVAREGRTGLVRTVPAGLPAGSDVATLSLLGYDPRQCYTGRGPLEALQMGLRLTPQDVVFRCNLVSVQDDTLTDYSAGHIAREDAEPLIAALNDALGTPEFAFHCGVSYRHLLVMRNGPARATCTPPHDITGQAIAAHLPAGEGAEALRILMQRASEILRAHPVNGRRLERGEPAANAIWLWGQGRAPQLTSFQSRFGLRGGVISAVDLIRGIGVGIGFEILPVPGMTGFLDTNYRGKAEAALAALRRLDLVVVHIEATDEAGHMGDLTAKLQAIEAVDREVVGPIREGLGRLPAWRLLISPDHATFVRTRTHDAMPVPFALCGSDVAADANDRYAEAAVARTSTLRFEAGHRLMEQFLNPEPSTP